jgi:8-oxo-dGTP pyrophosphatase MutT (NUDIX family)
MTHELLFYDDEYRSVSKKWPYHMSSGGVVYRVENRQLEVLLLKSNRRGYTSYHLPKGTIKLGETLEQCAMREIAEEAGVHTILTGYLGAQLRPAAGTKINGTKTVHFYAARFDGYTGVKTDGVYSGVIWVSPARAIELLRKVKVKKEDVFVERFLQLIQLIKNEKSATK